MLIVIVVWLSITSNECTKHTPNPLRLISRYNAGQRKSDFLSTFCTTTETSVTPVLSSPNYQSPGVLRVIVESSSKMYPYYYPRKSKNPFPFSFAPQAEVPRKIRDFSLPPASQEIKSAEESNREKENLGWQWYNFPENSLAVNFVNDTSLHGLNHVGRPKRHISERVFWIVTVLASIGTACYLILHLYYRNSQMPIIIVFNPGEKTIAEIPFPSVTVCNVNNIRKSKMSEALKRGANAMDGKLLKNETLRAYATLLDMFHICESSYTFTDRFARNKSLWHFVGNSLRNEMFKTRYEYEDLVNPVKTLAENSQPCQDMILYCIWLDEIRNCSEFFQQIETDYGSCCTFNSIPLTLLEKFRVDPRDDPKRIREWMDLNLNYDNLLFTKETKNRKYPFRQKYPGREAGLSILLDADLEEYDCTSQDSTGYIVALNVPLDFPRVRDHAVAVRTASEVFINVRPEVIMSDGSIKSASINQRKCYLGSEGELKLPHYTKYTWSNCMDECIAKRTKERCGCVSYYMPHFIPQDEMCRPRKYDCTKEVRKEIIKRGIGESCNFCLPSCTEIDYVAETTSLPLIKEAVEQLANYSLLESIFHKRKLQQASIVHIYFGVDSAIPRLRKENFSRNELISDAGGILALCLGFSVLSLMEVIYYVTIRFGCNWYRKKVANRIQGQVHPSAVRAYSRDVKRLQKNRENDVWLRTEAAHNNNNTPNHWYGK